MSEAGLQRDVAETRADVRALREALKGHVEFCTEDRKREAETRQRLDEQFSALMRQIAEVDGRRRETAQRLHEQIDLVKAEQAADTSALRAEQAAWRLRLVWTATLALVALLAGAGTIIGYLLAFGRPWVTT